MTSTFELAKSGPAELAQLVLGQFSDALSQQIEPEVAEKIALRRATLAGWYPTGDGWKQLSTDLRDKFAVRMIHRQPDGKNSVFGVPIFYPNAIKNDANKQPIPFDTDGIADIVNNTNRSSQLPTLTPYHIVPEQKLVGTVVPTLGYAANFRSIPDKDGWIQCDLRDLDDSTAGKWRDGKISTFSIGVIQDTGGTNRRIGHIALLGAEPAALSQIPRVEVYSSGEIVAFSYEAGCCDASQTRNTKMGNVTKSTAAPVLNFVHLSGSSRSFRFRLRKTGAHQRFAAGGEMISSPPGNFSTPTGGDSNISRHETKRVSLEDEAEVWARDRGYHIPQRHTQQYMNLVRTYHQIAGGYRSKPWRSPRNIKYRFRLKRPWGSESP